MCMFLDLLKEQLVQMTVIGLLPFISRWSFTISL